MSKFYFRFLSLRLRGHRHVILHLPAKFYPNRTIRDRVMTSYPFSNMAATASQFYFRFRFSWVRSFEKVEMYMQTTFWPDISIHGWGITTSGFWKQTAAILELYSRFRFSRLHHHRHAILHLPTIFRPNWTIHDIVMTSYPFFKIASTPSQFYFRLRFLRRNLPADQILARYLNPRLRYYYFRSLKTNGRHVGILLPVLIFTFAPPSACHSSATKLRPNRAIRDIVMTSYPFFKMAAAWSQFYFRFRFSWFRSFGKVVIYMQTKFRRDISIHGWNITTSGFDFHVCVTIGMSFCICLPISSKSDHPRHNYDRISIFHDDGRQPYWIISR